MEPSQKIHTIENIKKVALVFFIITGLGHFSSSILIANQILLKEAFIANKTLDVPFVITGLIYGFSCLRLSFADPEKDYKKLDIALIIVVVLALAGLIAVNIIFPDLKKI